MKKIIAIMDDGINLCNDGKTYRILFTLFGLSVLFWKGIGIRFEIRVLNLSKRDVYYYYDPPIKQG
ncbi:hypothetical protein [Chondrinema litorale]|uniref:hypothetical protein n=1 Tax=Chondrinema litorale TaxID=2994555 RepID=UPI002543CC22|nr:hypothetical protein [Chondrinema litorale]UZS00245.1 hypothetical protein OQ292_40605 [Chondrinema litorale]